MTLENKLKAKYGFAEEPGEASEAPPAQGPENVGASSGMRPTFPLAPKIPEFPRDPPKASAMALIQRRLLVHSGKTTLQDVADRIEAALKANQYYELNYYAFRDGFALASRIERINDDGTSKNDQERWTVDPPFKGKFTLQTYLRALFLAPPGRYRIIVFAVTAQPFMQNDNIKVSRQDAIAWVRKGMDILPETIGDREFSANSKCAALVYEFRADGRHSQVIDSSEIQGQVHLYKSGLQAALEKVPTKAN